MGARMKFMCGVSLLAICVAATPSQARVGLLQTTIESAPPAENGVALRQSSVLLADIAGRRLVTGNVQWIEAVLPRGGSLLIMPNSVVTVDAAPVVEEPSAAVISANFEQGVVRVDTGSGTAATIRLKTARGVVEFSNAFGAASTSTLDPTRAVLLAGDGGTVRLMTSAGVTTLNAPGTETSAVSNTDSPASVREISRSFAALLANLPDPSLRNIGRDYARVNPQTPATDVDAAAITVTAPIMHGEPPTTPPSISPAMSNAATSTLPGSSAGSPIAVSPTVSLPSVSPEAGGPGGPVVSSMPSAPPQVQPSPSAPLPPVAAASSPSTPTNQPPLPPSPAPQPPAQLPSPATTPAPPSLPPSPPAPPPLPISQPPLPPPVPSSPQNGSTTVPSPPPPTSLPPPPPPLPPPTPKFVPPPQPRLPPRALQSP